jgi:PhnB protein
MTTQARDLEQGNPSLSCYLTVRGAADALAFYKKAFGAVETVRMDEPNGRVGHAEMKIGDSAFMLADEYPELGILSPRTLGGSPVRMHLYVEDVDRTFADAVAAGATVAIPLKDEFYGDRTGRVTDPFGHSWILSTRKENLTPEEMQRRMDALKAKGGAPAAPKPAVNPIPAGMRTVTPYLVVKDAKRIIEFAKKAFGASEKFKSEQPDGKITHAEIRVGDSVVMLGEASAEWPARPAILNLYVEDVDAVYKRAVAAGGKSVREPATQFYGDRSAGVEDASGNQWWISTHVEDVSEAEIARRAKEQYAGAKG